MMALIIPVLICVLIIQSCPAICNLMDCSSLQVPLSMEFSRQEYWSRLSFPSPGSLPKPGIEFGSLALQVDFLLTEPQGSLYIR